MQTTTAECPYCGQIRTVMIPDDLDPQEELYCAQLEAIASCNCTQGAAVRNKNKILRIAEDHIEDVLRAAHPDAADLFQEAKEAVYDGSVFPTRLSHEAFPQGCPTCTRGGSRSSA